MTQTGGKDTSLTAKQGEKRIMKPIQTWFYPPRRFREGVFTRLVPRLLSASQAVGTSRAVNSYARRRRWAGLRLGLGLFPSVSTTGKPC